MSERKVLQKYYPPDFDPSALQRRRGPKNAGPRIQQVRIMCPFTMRCTRCGAFSNRGLKKNARKETPPDENSEIIIKTDPKNQDYVVVSGAVRNNEPWRNRSAEEESVEQRLDRLEREEAEAAGEEELDKMEELEAKNQDAQREMAAADALDEIRHRNARINRSEKEGVDFVDTIVRTEDEERKQQEKEDEEAAKAAFAAARAQVESSAKVAEPENTPIEPQAPATTFKRAVKKKKDHAAALGLKKKSS
ncbi:YJU2-Essential nuclear, spliceosomal component [Fusarium agapanthi]|uniref:YJU2-Essential nuclear, spliceosomal component n=1 Tax=Fusarium agapanthi TaxID=1803897 RepID=A0A9P5B1V6_9HYPO|nr:YJU2-Essential nuclear, spliceosomal component [Fusarium agapanthi]